MVQRWLESDLDTLFTSKEPLELGRLDIEDFFAELAKLLRAKASNDNEVTGEDKSLVANRNLLLHRRLIVLIPNWVT